MPGDDFDLEWQVGRGDAGTVAQAALRNGDVFLASRVGAVDEGEFDAERVFGIVAGLAFVEGHLGFPRHETGEKFAQQDHDDAEVDEHDAGFAPAQLEAGEMGGDQIDEEQACRACSRRAARGGKPVRAAARLAASSQPPPVRTS